MTVFGTPIRTSAISLARYAQIINYTDCAFFGVSHPGNDNYACREIWTKSQRDEVQFHLSEAQAELENVIGFPLNPKWFVNEVHPFRYKILTANAHVIELGVEAVDNIGLAAPVSLLTDPATVTIPATLTSTDGIKVYYPDTQEEISPSNLIITGGNLVIYIPQCRLVSYALLDNPSSGLLWSDPAIYQTTVDVKRSYTDPSDQIKVVGAHSCNSQCSSTGCAPHTDTACGVILDPEIGEISFEFATHSDGTWNKTRNLCCTGDPKKIRINYRAGMQILSPIAEMAIIRLAHSKMAKEPCGCDAVINMWRRDAAIPQLLSVERLECPFGLSNGAWMAWKFAGSLSVDRMSMFR